MSVRRKLVPAIALALALLALYSAFDLFWPRHEDFRQFDAAAVGSLETRMWRSYYGRRPAALFLELAETLRTQYHFPFLRSYLGAYHATSAAFTFKEGKQRSDYERALPALRSYFTALHNTGSIDFDVRRAAELELEWWIVHRERARHAPGDLGHACAAAAAILYALPVERTLEHGELRAQAMLIRDAAEERGEVSEGEWNAIESLLHRSYGSLHRAAAGSN